MYVFLIPGHKAFINSLTLSCTVYVHREESPFRNIEISRVCQLSTTIRYQSFDGDGVCCLQKVEVGKLISLGI